MEPSSFSLVPAAQLPYDHLARLINQTFADYYLTVWLDAYQFERMCYEEDIDLTKSVVAMVNDVPVGISLFSIRDSQGWISGVGVLPLWRRRGVAIRILHHIQAVARSDKLANLRLEVLTQNAGALALYRQLGFRWERDLLVLTLEPGLFSYLSPPPGILRADPDTLLKAYHRFHSMRNPWQRELPSLEHRKKHLFGWGMWENDVLVAYILTHIQSGNYAIADLAVDPQLPHRLQLARTLLLALHTERPDMGCHILNVPTESPLLPAFTGLSYRIWHRQHEMIWLVPDAHPLIQPEGD
ncbi:MAG: GNAT family N-acetyltransferase [Anaerolineales bacterium]|nr:MAG: GNAT family N-acetyltransferase [Anaerolineales bacterium]